MVISMKTKEELNKEMLDISEKIVALKKEYKLTGDKQTREKIKELQLSVLFYIDTIDNMD